jgi:hypothetical protein
MKKLLLFIGFIGNLIVTEPVRAAQPILVPLYNSVSNQLVIVSNTPPVDTKLAKSLKAALSALQKGNNGTDLTDIFKALSAAIKIVDRTSLSNALQGDLHATVLVCVGVYTDSVNSFSNQLALTYYPSTARTTALNDASNIVVNLANIGAMPDNAAAVQALLGLSTPVKAMQKVALAALTAPTPTATATVTITGLPALNFKSQQVNVQENSPGNFSITAIEKSGGTLQELAFDFGGLVAGANNVAITQGGYARGTKTSPLVEFSGTDGTVQVNWDPPLNFLSGTFTLNVQEVGGTVTGTVTGTFIVTFTP